jgi:signal transduction histidine kinase
VILHENDDAVEATIHDDGQGFDYNQTSSGFGLVGMRERVALLNGSLTIESGPGGTTVRAVLPVRKAAPSPSQ